MPSGRRGAALAGLLSVVLVTGVAGCAAPAPTTAPTLPSGGGTSAGAVAAGPPAPRPVPQEAFGVADVVFLQQMLPHHVQAAQLAELAFGRSASPQAQAVARSVYETTSVEIQDLARWLTALGIDPAGVPTTAAHAHAGGMTQQDVDTLGTLSGPAFDARFATLMTAHTLGAVEIAKIEIAEGTSPGARAFAADISQREFARLADIRAIG